MYVSEAGKSEVALFKADENLRLHVLGVHTLDIAPYRDTYYPPDQFDIAFADWEGDGRKKIFCVTGYAGDGYGRNVRLLSVTIQDGRATFTTESRHSHKFFGDQGPILAAAADINGNGKDELLLTNRWGSPPSSVRNSSRCTTRATAPPEPPVSIGATIDSRSTGPSPI